MRDNFSEKTKKILACRVAWRCSFPGCYRITIGPGNKSSDDVINLGEAAHITAASKKGPRYDEKLTSEERKSMDNGIWMCRHHAKLIDSDFENYSTSTIRQWKKIAEENTYYSLKEFTRDLNELPRTLVAIGKQIVFEGIWKSVQENTWVFDVYSFVIGNEKALIDFNNQNIERYVVVESQGDGRQIIGNVNWELKNNQYEISIKVGQKSKSTTPYHLKDISAKFEIQDGDLKIVEGEECAKQQIMITLSSDFGDFWYAPDFGSFFSTYYWIFKSRKDLLNRLVKLELTRLFSIARFDDALQKEKPPLEFIKRIVDVDVKIDQNKDNKVPVNIVLEWGDGNRWKDEIWIYLTPEKELTTHNTQYSKWLEL